MQLTITREFFCGDCNKEYTVEMDNYGGVVINCIYCKGYKNVRKIK